MDAYVDGQLSHTGVDLSYGPNGRTASVDFFGSSVYWGSQREMPDPDGLPRPGEIVSGWWDDVVNPVNWTETWTTGTYAYDGSGNVKSVTRTGAPSKQYAYDRWSRLTSYAEDGAEVRGYSYDDVGNLTGILPSAGDEHDFTPDAANRVTKVMINDPGPEIFFDWNERGNLEVMREFGDQPYREFLFSSEDRLLASRNDPVEDHTWRFAYDTAGERVAAWRRGPLFSETTESVAEVNLFLRDEGGRLLSEFLLLPDFYFAPKREYLHAAGRTVAQLDWRSDGAHRQFLVTDHLGSTRALVDGPMATLAEEYDFLPFGNFRLGPDNPDTELLFTGHERDLGDENTTLDYMHARYYSPNLGRFVSVDPVGGKVGSSQSWNRYSYVVNNPIGMIDPNGEDTLAFTAGVEVSIPGPIKAGIQWLNSKFDSPIIDPEILDLHYDIESGIVTDYKTIGLIKKEGPGGGTRASQRAIGLPFELSLELESTPFDSIADLDGSTSIAYEGEAVVGGAGTGFSLSMQARPGLGLNVTEQTTQTFDLVAATRDVLDLLAEPLADWLTGRD